MDRVETMAESVGLRVGVHDPTRPSSLRIGVAIRDSLSRRGA
jgi:hypothetical protein